MSTLASEPATESSISKNRFIGGEEPEHPPVAGLLGELSAQLGGLGDETSALERLAHEVSISSGVEGLGHEVEGPLLRRLHGLRDGGVARHDDDLERGILALEQPQQMEAIPIGQHQIHEGQGEFPVLDPEHGGHGARGRLDLVPLALEDQPEVVGDDGLVIDDENCGASWLLSDAHVIGPP